MRLGLLLAVLVVLAAVWWKGPFRGGGDVALGQGCPVEAVPPLAAADPAELAGFKADLERMIAVRETLVPSERRLVPYEEGVVDAAAAWSDAEPGTAGVPTSGSQPAGFEMRWWTVGQDDVVADVFLFEGDEQAGEFLDLATSTECRSNASRRRATLPLGGRNLEWSNPYDYAQQDVFLRRGSRVYRVSVVQPAVGARVSAPIRLVGFSLVGELACGFPGVGCAPEPSAPAATPV